MIGHPSEPQGSPAAPDLARDLAALERRVNILSATHEPVSPSRFVALEKSVRDMLPRLDTIEWDMRAQGAHVKGVEGDCNGLSHDITALTQRVAALEAGVKESLTTADPPAAPSLLSCPFCGGEAQGIHTQSSTVQCMACRATAWSDAAWNRRTPPDTRLRALAEAVVRDYEADEPTTRAVQALASYLRETAR